MTTTEETINTIINADGPRDALHNHGTMYGTTEAPKLTPNMTIDIDNSVGYVARLR